jgi:glutaconate CoA-transferase subunit B
MEHSRRRFVPRVDFISGAGFIDGPGAREKAGLRRGGPRWVLSELGVFDFDPATCRMRVKSIHPGHTIAEVRDQTGFDLVVPPQVPDTTPPTAEELRLLRREIDPHGVMLASA